MAHVLAKDLREAVLQAAITGGLSSKKQEDTKVDDLLKEIEIEKKHLMEKGLIPKEKKLKPINDDDIVLEIPKHWKMVRTQDISTYITDYVANGSFATLKQNTTTYQYEEYAIFVRTVDLTSNFKGKLSYIDEKSYNWLSKSKLYGGELILPNIGGSIGKTFIMPKLNKPMSLAPNSIMLKFHYDVLNVFFSYIIQSPYGQNLLISTKGGTATPKFSKTDLRNMVIPITSIEEIIRIVAKVDEIMAKIDEYEKLENKLVKLKEQFPQDMKESLFQFAVQGDLTNRLSTDSNVVDFLNSIRDTKNTLLKNKKIKKDKTQPINYDEVPFDIPNEWQWTKLGMLANLRTGKTPPRSEPVWWGKANNIPWVSIGDMKENGLINTTNEFISEKGFDEKFNRTISPKGTLIMSFKLTIGRVSILDMDALHNEAIISIFPYVDEYRILQKYLFKALPYLVKYGDSKNAIKGSTLNSDSLCNLYIPLPPIEEQQRIVDKLDELLPLVDKLAELN